MRGRSDKGHCEFTALILAGVGKHLKKRDNSACVLLLILGTLVLWAGCDGQVSGIDDDYTIPVGYTRTIDEDPDWSPDGKTIAYCHRPGAPEFDYEIWLLDIETMERRYLTDGRGKLDWSPDGTKIAFIRNNDIHIIHVETEEITRLTDWGECFFPSWSPDGTRIVFENTFGDSAGAWIMNSDGTHKEKISWFPGSHCAWSPDGPRIAMVTSRLADNAPYEELAVINLEDSTFIRLTDNNRSDRGPCWSPDGVKIAWSSHGELADPNNGIWVMNADGTDQHLLTRAMGEPTWSPDGGRIIYTNHNTDSDTVTLWIMNSDGSDARPLTLPDDY